MIINKFSESVISNLSYTPNEQQMSVIAGLSDFCVSDNGLSLFLLNGYAGTGKTSLIGAVVKSILGHNMKCVLLAPTGRAAKVFSEYSGYPVLTIHKKIYRQKSFSPEYGNFILSENKHKNTLFIVDEASMIPNATTEGAFFGSGGLLDDLVEYVYGGHNCRLILSGDNAQLPPVGFPDSPALNIDQLKSYGLDIMSFVLTNSMRQSEQSGILYNATELRKTMSEGISAPPEIKITGLSGTENISGEYVLEKISDCYDSDGINNTIIITRSNKRAALFNSGIRGRILYREDELVAGDMLLVSKNNYFWGANCESLDFIANGDVARVIRVKTLVNKYGFRFADVELELPDRGVEINAKIILDTLCSDAPSLTMEQNQKLYNEIINEMPGTKREKYKALKVDEFFNALQVKYAYAVTCHKAQGGQWKNVFIDMGYIQENALVSLDFFRWLYTALTRATDKVYLINSQLSMI